jgi:hypothetical protein
MKGSPEKYEDIRQYELEALKEVKRKMIDSAGQNKKNVDLVKGAVLGLILGIGGTVSVQSLLPIIDALLLGEYNQIPVVNLAVCAVSLIVMIFVSGYFYHQLRNLKKWQLSRESIDVIEYGIKRRQYSLEQKRKNRLKQSR